MTREEKILLKTFQDHLTVYRSERYVDPESKESVSREVMVYQDAPCALSTSSRKTPEKLGVTSKEDTEMLILTLTDVAMKANDRAEVTTKTGQIFKGRTGRTFIYTGSHGETGMHIETLA